VRKKLSRAWRAPKVQPNRATVWLSGQPEGQKPATPPFGLDDARDCCQNSIIRLEANPVSVWDLDSLEYATDQTTEEVFPTSVERCGIQRARGWQILHLLRLSPRKEAVSTDRSRVSSSEDFK
jgi:hypothetical protein